MSVNKQIVLGKVAKDPEIRSTQNGGKVATFSVSTSYGDGVTWHNVVLFDKLADYAEASLKKGHLVFLEGRTRQRKWQDRSGNDRYVSEIIGSFVTSQEIAENTGDSKNAMSVNKLALLGRLGRDPETRTTQKGGTVVTFSVATNYGEDVDWHNIVLFDKLAEVAEQYLAKGHLVYIEGRTQHRKYDDKDGNERHITEVIASFLDLQPNQSGSDQDRSRGSSNREFERTEDDAEIPY